MSQIQMNTNSNVANVGIQQNQNVQSANNGQRDGLPQALQNARPSTSMTSRVGHAIRSFFSAVGSAFSTAGLAIKDLSVTAFFHVVYAIRPPQPRVPQNPTGIPLADPSVDAHNNALVDGFLKDKLPDAHCKALENTVTHLRTIFGAESLPAGITDLPPATDAANKFHHSLYDAMNNAEVAVTPAVLCRLAEDILKPMAAKHALQEVLAQKAAELNVAIRPEALPVAVEGLLAAKGQGGMSLVDVGNTHTAKALVDEVSPQKLEAVLKNSALIDGLQRGDLPTFHSDAVTSLLIELKTSFGLDTLPDTLADVLSRPGNFGITLGEKLQNIIAESKTTITPTDLRSLVERELKPVAQRKSLEQALQDRLKADPSLGRIHPELVSVTLDTILETNPHLSVAGLKNKDDALKLLYDKKVTDFLQQQEANMRSVEDAFLPSVHSEVQPLLKNFIRSLPFDSAHAGESRKKIENLTKDMATWRNIHLNDNDPGLTAYCEHVKTVIDEDVHHLEGNPAPGESMNNYEDNIYTTMISDVPRCDYAINGRVFPFGSPVEGAISALKQCAPNTVDQQFLSKIVNQRLTPSVTFPMRAGHHVDSKETPTTQAEKTCGISFHEQQDYGFLFTQSSSKASYRISIADDGKTAEITCSMHGGLQTENFDKPFYVGTVTHVVVLKCDLSAGSPDGQPRVTEMKMIQSFNPEQF